MLGNLARRRSQQFGLARERVEQRLRALSGQHANQASGQRSEGQPSWDGTGKRTRPLRTTESCGPRGRQGVARRARYLRITVVGVGFNLVDDFAPTGVSQHA